MIGVRARLGREARAIAVTVAAIAFFEASSARAAPDAELEVEAARQAFAEGTAAHERGDDATAAIDYARADALAPSPVALEAGLKAAILADKPEIGMTLVRRAEERGDTAPALAEWVAAARAKFKKRVGRLEIRCDAPGCSAALDGLPAPTRTATFVLPGSHVVELRAGERFVRMPAQVVAEGEIVVEPPRGALEPPPPISTPSAPKPPPEVVRGIAPAWFFGALGLTAAFGGATIASGLDTKAKHDAWVADPHDVEAQTSGQSAQTRTNILLATTGGLALATAGIGAFAVRWRAPARVSISVNGGGGAILLSF